ncbi:spondin domain-containing protein [Hahella ganghwensis]|uniref:spondin domain-containing protein n=1 Tax=Hahella ganghwensis TaxID=286420 RepID=UPI0003615A6C|nr:spondin domain-containing protein [Hahella ganghwensis]
MKFVSIAATALLVASSAVSAGGYGHTQTYKVVVTNITKGISFTPILAATHKSSVQYFELGEPASEELSLLAEGGDTGPLNAVLDSLPHQVHSTAVTSGLLGPGQSVEFEIESSRRFRYLSFAGMLLPTNDSFVALNSVPLPWFQSSTYFARGYDAGSEPDDELCVNIPGPTCGGEGASPGVGGEGYVYISPGIHGEGDLSPAAYDWRDAVAKVTITRTH